MFDHIDDLIASIIVRTHHKTSLEKLRKYLALHGSPQEKLRCIHVAGTNGKGSTTNYLRSILQQNGYRVGTFTSPHLEHHQDRIRVNDLSIPDDIFLEYGNRYNEEWLMHQLNMFEIDLFVSILYFVEQQVDFAIYEVGMGGRLDSTNVILPLLSIITNIGMDHMQFLGDTYEKIAAEKAGIIKACVPLITSEKKEKCLAVFRGACEANQATMLLVEEPIIHSKLPMIFDYKQWKDIKITTGGFYQINNVCLVLEAIAYLSNAGIIQTSESAIREGLLTSWKGRFEKMADVPSTFVDGAHNVEGIKALCETLACYPGPKKIIVSILKDKPVYPMLEELLQCSDELILTEFEYPRVFRVTEFDGSLPLQINDSYESAIEKAMSQTEAMVVITGSLYFISVARDYLLKRGTN